MVTQAEYFKPNKKLTLDTIRKARNKRTFWRKKVPAKLGDVFDYVLNALGYLYWSIAITSVVMVLYLSSHAVSQFFSNIAVNMCGA